MEVVKFILKYCMGWLVALGIFIYSEIRRRKEKRKISSLMIKFMKLLPHSDDKEFRWQQIVVKNMGSEQIELTSLQYHQGGEKTWIEFPIFGSGGKTGPFTKIALQPSSRHKEDIWLDRNLLLDNSVDWIALKDSKENYYFIPQKEYVILELNRIIRSSKFNKTLLNEIQTLTKCCFKSKWIKSSLSSLPKNKIS